MESTDGTENPKFIVKVQGPHNEKEPDHREKLLAQLCGIPRDIATLGIDEDTPSNIEWSILGDHFSHVKDLEIETGWNEELNDEKMPLHWPLKRLFISSAGAEVFRSPFVHEGRVEHLILFLTNGLRFEGPASDELTLVYDEAVEDGGEEARHITVEEGTSEERKIQITSLPELVGKWMDNKYSASDSVTSDLTTVT